MKFTTIPYSGGHKDWNNSTIPKQKHERDKVFQKFNKNTEKFSRPQPLEILALVLLTKVGKEIENKSKKIEKALLSVINYRTNLGEKR